MKFHVWMLLLLSFLASCSTVKLPSLPVESTPTEITEPVIISPEVPTTPVVEVPPTPAAEIPSQGTQPIGPEYPVPGVKKVFTVHVEDSNYKNYSGAEEKLKKAVALIKIVMNSVEYRDAVLNHTFKGNKTFFWNEKLTNEQIYEKLFAGAEGLMPAVNYQLDLKVKMYYSKLTSTVGYTYPSDLFVYTNWKFHQNYKPCRIASNIVHEWTHKMGFGHTSNYTSDRNFTVPYAHNDIIESLCEKAEKGQLTGI